MSWVDDRAKYEAIAWTVEPALILTTKDGWFWRALACLIPIVTFGGLSRKEFLEDYGTTIGPLMATPRSWPRLSEGYVIHEATHAADMRKAGLGIHPWVGLLFYGIAYLLLIFPVGLAWCRYRLELRADTAAWRYELIHGLRNVPQIRERAKKRGGLLKGGAYGYAWPWAQKGYENRAEAVIKGAANDAKT